MKKGLENTLTQTDVAFGDALCKLYRFEMSGEAPQKASDVPILHVHPFFEGMICTLRPYRVLYGEKEVSLTRGTLFLLSPKEAHCAVREGNTAPISFGISVEKREGKFGFYRRISKCIDDIAGEKVSVSDQTAKLFEKWSQANGASFDEYCASCVLSYRFLYALLKDIGAVDDSPFALSKDKKESTSALLDTLLDDRRYTLNEIAAALGYTRKHVLRLIWQRYGCDFRSIKRRKAIEAAKAYLCSQSGMSVSEIARALGYESESAFYVFFKRETGQTPREYQKNHCKDEEGKG